MRVVAILTQWPDRTIAQAVSRHPLTTSDGVRANVSPMPYVVENVALE